LPRMENSRGQCDGERFDHLQYNTSMTIFDAMLIFNFPSYCCINEYVLLMNIFL
jgi:hypothetical protein